MEERRIIAKSSPENELVLKGLELECSGYYKDWARYELKSEPSNIEEIIKQLRGGFYYKYYKNGTRRETICITKNFEFKYEREGGDEWLSFNVLDVENSEETYSGKWVKPHILILEISKEYFNPTDYYGKKLDLYNFLNSLWLAKTAGDVNELLIGLYDDLEALDWTHF